MLVFHALNAAQELGLNNGIFFNEMENKTYWNNIVAFYFIL